MKQFLILILLFFSAFEIKAQRDYESPDAKQKVLSHKNFAIVPFNFKVMIPFEVFLSIRSVGIIK